VAHSRSHNRRIAEGAARRHGVPVGVFLRQMKQEAGFQTGLSSPAGASGPAQIMPATARGWGVKNVNDPVEAYNAAAKAMAKYIRSYGVEGALRAYNAGPGAVQKSKGYAETNNYVKTILGGLKNTKAPSRRGGGGSVGSVSTGGIVPARSTLRESEQFDAEGYELAQKKAALANLLKGQKGYSTLFQTGALSLTPPDPAQFTTRRLVGKTTAARVIPGRLTPGSPSSRGSGSPSSRGRAKGTLRESFYNGPGGVNVDDGKKVAKGYVSGHTDHVHAAADNDEDRIWLEVQAKKRGLTVTSEGGGKHAAGSFHYQRTKKGRSKGIDVSGDPAAMAAYSRDVARYFGISGGRRRRR
jgi:hypothetical protein